MNNTNPAEDLTASSALIEQRRATHPILAVCITITLFAAMTAAIVYAAKTGYELGPRRGADVGSPLGLAVPVLAIFLLYHLAMLHGEISGGRFSTSRVVWFPVLLAPCVFLLYATSLNYGYAVRQSLRSRERSDLQQIVKALDAYKFFHSMYPAGLDQLLGPTLSALPTSPFAPGVPLRYERFTQQADGRDGYLLWSVGPDGQYDISPGTPLKEMLGQFHDNDDFLGMVYDPSNGMSSGDAVCFDSGGPMPLPRWKNNRPAAKPQVVASESSKTLTLILRGGVKLELVRVPAGRFRMGNSQFMQDSISEARPMHDVDIAAFYIGKYEVTQAQWRAVMGSLPKTQFGSGPDHPVSFVSWNDCQTFVSKLNAMGIGKFRLPSEAEWEYACRAGTMDHWFFGGDGASRMYSYGWCNYRDSTQPVGQKRPNAFGLYDVYGNVGEWVQDTYHVNYNGAPTDGSAWVDDTDDHRVIRGGGFSDNYRICRSAYRQRWRADMTIKDVGLRIVREAE